jgi:hypothetical protein
MLVTGLSPSISFRDRWCEEDLSTSIPERLVSANFPGEFPTALRTFGSADSSLRDADTADQILVARIRPYGVENWFNFEIDHEIIAFVDTFF